MSEEHPVTTTTDPTDTSDAVVDDPVLDDPVLDEEWLAAPRRRSRFRLGLAVALGAALCFLGGVLVQQQLGTTTSSAAAGGFPGGLAGSVPEGFPGGGALPDGGAVPGGADQGSRATDGGDESTAVIGTVVAVHGDTWVVKDLGGTRHRVRLADGTDVVRETDADPGDVGVGDDVDISGTDDGGLLDAEQVTLR